VPTPLIALSSVWLAASAIVAATAFLAIRRAARDNETVTAVGLTACAELLISPVSWSHHWVWVAPLLVCALLEGWRRRRTTGPRYLIVAALVTAVFLAAPQIWFPHSDNRELGWGWWEQIIGSSYVWVALVALCIFAFRPRRPVPEPLDPRRGPAVEPLSRADQPEADPRHQAAMERLTDEASANAGSGRRRDGGS
jgi:alpha-1,2-mannosyltransferase